MANVRALVHSTISTMLHNLKDGQVYISVDDVHQYLKNAGNTIAKETIQRTQCKDSVYEKVRHGAKNSRNGSKKSKIYYKLIDIERKNLPMTRTVPILRYNSLQLQQDLQDKTAEMETKVKQNERGAHNKRKRKLLKRKLLPTPSNQKPGTKKWSMGHSLANKIAQLQHLYVENSGAAPLSLLQPKHLFIRSAPDPPPSFRYAEKILHYILHGVEGPALAHIIGMLTAMEEEASKEVKSAAAEVTLTPEDPIPMHPPVENPTTSVHKSLVLGLGLVHTKEKLSHAHYVCILASDIVMKVRKPRYMSPMQQVMGNFLFANNCRSVVADTLHLFNVCGTRKTIKKFVKTKSDYNEHSNINIIGNEIGEDKIAIFAYDNLEFKSKSGALAHYVTIVRLAIPKSRCGKNPPEVERVALTHANVVGELLSIPRKLLEIGVEGVIEMGKQLKDIKNKDAVEPASVLMQNTMHQDERGLLVEHHDEVLDVSPARHILEANEAEVFAVLKLNLGSAETVRTVMNIIDDFTPEGQSRYMVGDGAPTYMANLEQQQKKTTPATVLNNIASADTTQLVVVAATTKNLGLKIERGTYKSRGLLECLKVVGFDDTNTNLNTIEAQTSINIGDIFFKINTDIVATKTIDELINAISNTPRPFTITFIKANAVNRIGAQYDKAVICHRNNLNINLEIPFRIIPGLWHSKFKLLQNIQDDYGSLFLVQILKKYGRTSDGKIQWILKPGKPRDAFIEMRMVLLGLQQAACNACKHEEQKITEDLYLTHIWKRAKEMPIVACVWEWMFQFKLIMHFEEAVHNGDIQTIMQLLKTLLLNCATSNSYKYIYFLLIMFRDRLQLGPEEKQVIDGLAFLARTVNGVRMEMDLFVENVQLLFRNKQGKTERVNTYEMLCMQASLMDETHAMRSKSRHADKISSSEYRIQLQMGMNTYQYHKAYEAALEFAEETKLFELGSPIAWKAGNQSGVINCGEYISMQGEPMCSTFFSRFKDAKTKIDDHIRSSTNFYNSEMEFDPALASTRFRRKQAIMNARKKKNAFFKQREQVLTHEQVCQYQKAGDGGGGFLFTHDLILHAMAQYKHQYELEYVATVSEQHQQYVKKWMELGVASGSKRALAHSFVALRNIVFENHEIYLGINGAVRSEENEEWETTFNNSLINIVYRDHHE